MKSPLTIAAAAAAVVLVMLGVAHTAPTDAEKCLSSKLKEVGKYDSCRLKAEAKGVIKNEAPDTTKCDTKFASNWAKIETKAAGACPTTGDVVPIGGDVTTHVAQIVVALSAPVCGNNLAQAPEDCDGVDLGGGTCATEGFDYGTLACTGACTFDTSGCALSCDPVAQTCGGGQGCYHFDTTAAACAAAGSDPLDAPCTFLNDCGVGAVCSSGFCKQYCDTSAPSCPVSTTCTSIGFVPYPNSGLCL